MKRSDQTTHCVAFHYWKVYSWSKSRVGKKKLYATKIIMQITENMMEYDNQKNERNVEEKMLGFISHLKKYMQLSLSFFLSLHLSLSLSL